MHYKHNEERNKNQNTRQEIAEKINPLKTFLIFLICIEKLGSM